MARTGRCTHVSGNKYLIRVEKKWVEAVQLPNGNLKEISHSSYDKQQRAKRSQARTKRKEARAQKPKPAKKKWKGLYHDSPTKPGDIMYVDYSALKTQLRASDAPADKILLGKQ